MAALRVPQHRCEALSLRTSSRPPGRRRALRPCKQHKVTPPLVRGPRANTGKGQMQKTSPPHSPSPRGPASLSPRHKPRSTSISEMVPSPRCPEQILPTRQSQHGQKVIKVPFPPSTSARLPWSLVHGICSGDASPAVKRPSVKAASAPLLISSANPGRFPASPDVSSLNHKRHERCHVCSMSVRVTQIFITSLRGAIVEAQQTSASVLLLRAPCASLRSVKSPPPFSAHSLFCSVPAALLTQLPVTIPGPRLWNRWPCSKPLRFHQLPSPR